MTDRPAIEPGSWRDRPALIERIFPAQQISVEAQTERKANAGQTLTSLGSYWKGRKPLVLVRACVLGSLLPATGDDEESLRADLEVFELLMGMDDDAFEWRARVQNIKRRDVEKWGGDLRDELLDADGRWRVRGAERASLLGRMLAKMPYADRLRRRSLRPEEMPPESWTRIWDRVNAHLGTTARTHAELVEQLGLARFGRRPRLADPFCGGGSIPFEAARMGCDVVASDLNPIACMLTWGAFNVVGADEQTRETIAAAQARVLSAVEKKIVELGVEHDEHGNRAKAFLYCMEARTPDGWLVPMASSWVISRNKRCVARLVPRPDRRRFEIELVDDASDEELLVAKTGTVQKGWLVWTDGTRERRIRISTLRGDRRVDRETRNDLRLWTRDDFVPRADDLFQERLYAIQWFSGESRRETFFSAVDAADVARERRVVATVAENLAGWQESWLVPDMPLEMGSKTREPIRTRGWSHWHHLFTPRALLVNALFKQAISTEAKSARAEGALSFALNSLADRSARLSRWEAGFPGRPGVAPSADAVKPVFYNQALNTLYNYGARSFCHLKMSLARTRHAVVELPGDASVRIETAPAWDPPSEAELWVSDPPYADAVAYDEITEFFIAWQRKGTARPFQEWIWDSRRALAVTGQGDDFRRDMVRAYRSMASRTPRGGLQIVMFTHQDAGVWADMAAILWGAGLQVTAAWYIATETTSEIKKGGYVQGTVILVLRRRDRGERAYRDELVLDIKDEVREQIDSLVGLKQSLQDAGRIDNLFEDADLQMAGYAAALKVLTGCSHIDNRDMAADALRPRAEGASRLVDELIEYAVQVANEYLVPEGLSAATWERLSGVERFYLRMIDVEAGGGKKLDNYQNFAKAFRVDDWQRLMEVSSANEARLKGAVDFGAGEFEGSEFADSLVRAVLFGLYELCEEIAPDDVLSHLRDQVPDYFRRRDDVRAVTAYFARHLTGLRPEEAAAARILEGLVRHERLGA